MSACKRDRNLSVVKYLIQMDNHPFFIRGDLIGHISNASSSTPCGFILFLGAFSLTL